MDQGVPIRGRQSDPAEPGKIQEAGGRRKASSGGGVPEEMQAVRPPAEKPRFQSLPYSSRQTLVSFLDVILLKCKHCFNQDIGESDMTVKV